MIKNLLFPLFIAFILSSLPSCKSDRIIDGSGRITTESRGGNTFYGVVSEADFDVDIEQSQSANYEVVVEADANFQPYISTGISNGDLMLGISNDHVLKGDRVKIHIKTPSIDYINLAGAGYMTCDYVYNNSMQVLLSGTGDISMLGMDTKELKVTISGTGNIDLDGKADRGDLTISGSGDIKGYGLHNILEMSDCYVTISGSGNASVYVYDYLEVYISGDGNVLYRNKPGLKYEIPGSGSIIDDNK